MYKNLFCTLVIIAGLLFSSLGCIAADDTVTVAQFNPVKAIADRLATKEAIWDSYGAKITVLETHPQASPATDLTDINNKISALQTKTSDNSTMARLQEAIDRIDSKLKTSPYTGYTPTSPGTTSPLQTTSVSGGNGAVQIALQGYPQPFTTSSTAVTQSYFVTLTCLSTVPQYFIPTVTLQPVYGQSNTWITEGSISGQYGSFNNIGFNSIIGTTSQMLIMTNASSGGYNSSGAIYVSPGAPGLLVLSFTSIKSNNVATWNVNISGSSSNVY
jgi:hypothetical protein